CARSGNWDYFDYW
nr:immunoglobulin heavy chain junction region [Mus musculus]NSM05530.1 immunoglobulin heavy chain junction region [Mus musculus]